MSRWFACELHCHTLHSDGAFSVERLLKTAKERKLDGICLTDHNTTSGWEETEKYSDIAVLNGIEWTTYFGHMLVLDPSRFVDWRDAVPDNIDEKMKEVHQCGGLVGIAHPFQLGTPVCTGGRWDYNVRDFGLVDYMEIWSEGNPFMSAANTRAYELWVSLLDRGYKTAACFGRDWHDSEEDILPCACTYLCVNSDVLTPQGIKEAVKHGKTSVSAGPLFCFDIKNGEAVFETDFSRVEAMNTGIEFIPERIKLLTNGNKEALNTAYGEKVSCSIETKDKNYYRAELWGSVNGEDDCLISFTSPVYIGY